MSEPSGRVFGTVGFARRILVLKLLLRFVRLGYNNSLGLIKFLFSTASASKQTLLRIVFVIKHGRES